MTDKTTELLLKLQAGQISLEDCQDQLKVKTKAQVQVQYKATPKGCIGFYNVRRMPVSLYIEELEKILESILQPGFQYSDEFQEFLDANSSTIKRK
jgi:hypothetical protein